HPSYFNVAVPLICKKSKEKPRIYKKVLTEEKKKAAEILTHLTGSVKNGGYPSVRLLLCFDQHAMLGSERLYYKFLFRSFGLNVYKIRSGMVDYVFRRHHPYLRKLQSLFYCDSIIVGSKINDKIDPMEKFSELMKEINGPQPRMFIANHRVPIKNRFILTGGRVDYNIYNALHLQSLVKLPLKEQILYDISVTLSTIPMSISSNLNHHSLLLYQNVNQLATMIK
ncbi:hypothetical protein MXB_1034, partial [Myxobolus squamalis]